MVTVFKIHNSNLFGLCNPLLVKDSLWLKTNALLPAIDLILRVDAILGKTNLQQKHELRLWKSSVKLSSKTEGF